MGNESVSRPCPLALSCKSASKKTKRTFYLIFSLRKSIPIQTELRIAFTQNNCEATEVDEQALVERAWKFFKSYLEWEDRHIDEERVSKMN